MKPNVVRDKSFSFAVRILKFCQQLKSEHREYELASQMLRSGTSIGANVEEALSAQSRKDFVHKLSIAAKEARETNYWLRLLVAANINTEPRLHELHAQSEELIRILNSILLSCRKREADSVKESPVRYDVNSEFRIQNSELEASE